jgi:hypothetical protein
VRVAIALVLVAGCIDFSPGGSPAPADGSPPADAVGPDGPLLTPLAQCPAETALIACWLMDGDPADGSANNHEPVVVSDVEFSAGIAGDAVVMTDNDRFTVKSSDAFSAAAITVETWLRIDERPGDGADQRVAVLDNEGQYGVFVLADGSIDCVGGGGITAAPALSPGEWHHVACVWGAEEGNVVFVDGVELASTAGMSLDTSGNSEIEIGSAAPFAPGASHLVGALDNLLVWNGPRSRDQLCATSGIPCD